MKFESQILHILTNYLNINRELLKEQNFNEPLTGKVFKLNYRDLIYLFFLIEKRYNLKIQADLCLNYGFNTINNIIQICLKSEDNISDSCYSKAQANRKFTERR